MVIRPVVSEILGGGLRGYDKVTLKISEVFLQKKAVQLISFANYQEHISFLFKDLTNRYDQAIKHFICG